MRLQPRHPVVHRQRTTEAIALQLIATQSRQRLRRRQVLHSLCHHLQPQRVAQRYHRMHDGSVRAVVQHAVDKGLVHLEFVDLKALQIRQAGVAGAKVINGDLHTQRLECTDLRLRRYRVVHEL